jgi:multidrug efflux pump subunit AcrA (membrane-fusion protein)
MKLTKMLLVFLVLGAVITVLPGCKAAAVTNTSGTAASQTAAVTRGNLTLDISAAGNLALSDTKDLAVDLFYPTGTKGTIGEVLVEEGDTVTKSQVLVTIDKSEWNDQLSTVEDLVTVKERALVQAQINLKTAEQTLKNTQDTISTREIAVINAKVSLQQADNTLDTSITAIDDQAVLAALRKARSWFDYITTTYKTIAPNPEDYTLVYEDAKTRLTIAQTNYDNMLAGYSAQEVTIKKNQVKAAEMTLAAAESDLIDARDDVDLKQLSLTLSQGNLQDAEKALEDAKTNLTEAQGKSPEIVAPFDGFVTKINVKGGDEVLNGTIAVQVADPDKFEAAILVSEMDIPKVKLGSQASVTLSSLPGVILTAKVTQIAPTATISSGVVNFNVKVEIQAPGSNPFSQFGNMPVPTGNGTMPTFPSGNFSAPGGFSIPGENKTGAIEAPSGFPSISSNQSFGSFLPTTNTDIQLREGLTVTVSIIADSRTNVLLVPNGAVTTEGFQSYVQVVKASGETEKRAVTTGISNWMFTEITKGLEEGEKVKVTLNLAPPSNSRGGGFFMGG